MKQKVSRRRYVRVVVWAIAGMAVFSAATVQANDFRRKYGRLIGKNTDERWIALEDAQDQQFRFKYNDDTTVTNRSGVSPTAASQVLDGLIGSLELGSILRVSYAETPTASAESVAHEIVIMPDSGRSDYLLLFGIEFSDERDDFSQQDLVLDFVTLQRRLAHVSDDDGHARAIQSYVAFGSKTIPVEEPDQGSEPDSGSDQSGDEGAASGSNDANGNGTGDSTEFDTFLKSRKAIALELGVGYVWESRRSDDVLGFGPVFKAGIQSVSDSSESTSTGNNTSLFFAGGVRFTRTSRTIASAQPKILAFTDIVVGRFDNFLSAEQAQAAGQDIEDRRWPRVAITAMQKLIGDIYVGVRANVGPGRDDLRFFVSAVLDVSVLGGVVGGS